MANMTSQVTLAVHVAGEQALENLKATLKEVEALLKENKDVKFSIESPDLEKMSKALTDISAQLKELGTDSEALSQLGKGADASGIQNISNLVNDLAKDITDLGNQQVNTNNMIDLSGPESKVKALQAEIASLNVTMSGGSSYSKTETSATTATPAFDMSSWTAEYTKQLDEMTRAAEEASQKMAETFNGTTGTKYLTNAESRSAWVSQFDAIETGVSSSLDKMRGYTSEYSNLIKAFMNDMAAASAQGVEFNEDFLLGRGWDESTLQKLPTYMKYLDDATKSLQGLTKVELGDLGLANISKEIDSLSTSLAKNTFGTQMTDIEKTLDDFSNIDSQQFTNLRTEFADFSKDLSELRNNYSKENGLDVNSLLNLDDWDSSKLANWYTNFKNFYDNVKNSAREFKNMEGNVDLDKVIKGLGDDAKVNSYTKQIDDLRTSISKLGEGEVKTSLTQQADNVQAAYDKMVTAVQKYQETARNTNPNDEQYKVDMNAATQAVQEYTNAWKASNSAVSQAMQSQSSGMASFASTVSSGLNGAIDVLNKMFGYNAIFREMRQVAQDCVSTIREVDSAMNQLEIVTGATATEMNEFFEASITQAKELGQSVTDVLDSIQVYSRLGYNLEEASELAEYTSVLSNVANVGTEEATQGLTSVIKGFDMSVDDAEHVADVLIDIGQSYAVSASEILEAFTRSSAAFGATGTTFEEASAIIAAGMKISNARELWKHISKEHILLQENPKSLTTTITGKPRYDSAKAEKIVRMNIWREPTYSYLLAS